MGELRFGPQFEDFKEQAKGLLAQNLAPIGFEADNILPPPYLVPREFVKLAERVSCHSDPNRWEILYRMLWRLAHGQRKLLEIEIDEDTAALHRMEKEVIRDCYKMRRALKFHASDTAEFEEVAWCEPDHRVLRLVAPYFAQKNPLKRWTILTPFERARWDGAGTLSIQPGGTASASDPQLTLDVGAEVQKRPSPVRALFPF